ncbi:hypothetical protein PGH07_00895 [Sulfurovum sp. zt1-1]|uniref:Uncharacterized protein n=1 Tax=Sulfurovum zhangzhouensis TaxID=3019067 RepID=A0ABT7QV76_9BACT|nr:hypothetical protein [Sulfurovum zhangzhouensis]MDM5270731.1 hypothetical protein [Sulfurovum zhangzhouensis]
MSVKHFIAMVVVSATLVAQTSETKKTYGIQTGQVEYEIYGSGVVTPDSNLSIEGYEKFSFREWGKERIEEMERTETLYGTLQIVDKEKTLKKSKQDTLYIVDFDNENIITSNLMEGDIGQIDVSRMQKAGMMNIASLDCEVWVEGTRKVCLYEGIVLLDEKSYLGFVYGKRATDVSFDVNLSDEDFELPDYSAKEDLLIINVVTTTQTYKAESISDKIIHANETNITSDDKDYVKAVNGIVQDLFEKEKKYLPLLLKTMRKTRACLHVAQSQSDANECYNEINELKSEFNDDSDDTLIMIIDENKQSVLDDFDKKIRALKTRVPCINRAMDMTDLSACMK